MDLGTIDLHPEAVEALVEGYRRRLQDSMGAWAAHCLAPLGQFPARHHNLIISELEGVARGHCDRLMLFLPPGSAKSTYASDLFPPWFLAQHSGLDVIAASHTVSLAETFGRRARDRIAEHGDMLGLALEDTGTAAGSWRTANGGRYFAVGVGGSVAGRRADVALVDDPVASQEDADSERIRDKTWEWYQADLLTRLKPGGRVVIIMTRWHQDDLAGRLLQTEGERWRVLRLPALAETDDALGRALGEPLWSDDGYGYGAEMRTKLASYEAQGGLRYWHALYQQSPRPAEGALFRVEKMPSPLDEEPKGQSVRAWDLAATAAIGSRDPDYTVGVKLIRESSGRFVVADVARLRGPPEAVEELIVRTAMLDGPGVTVSLPQDPGQAGVAQVLYLTRKLAGYRVESTRETGDKETRAAPVASQFNVGNVALVRARWNPAFLDELGAFPGAGHDDQVDALSRAFGVVGMTRGPIRISPEALARVSRPYR